VPWKRAKAAELTAQIKSDRGTCKLFVFEESDERDAGALKFWEYLGGRKAIAAAIPDTPQKQEKKLFRLSDETGKMLMVEVKNFTYKSLDSKDAFILDNGVEIFVWVGKGASKEERSKGLAYASDYLYKNNKPKNMPLSRIIEGSENDYFIRSFDN